MTTILNLVSRRVTMEVHLHSAVRPSSVAIVIHDPEASMIPHKGDKLRISGIGFPVVVSDVDRTYRPEGVLIIINVDLTA